MTTAHRVHRFKRQTEASDGLGGTISRPTDDCGICGVETCRHDGAGHPWTMIDVDDCSVCHRGPNSAIHRGGAAPQ